MPEETAIDTQSHNDAQASSATHKPSLGRVIAAWGVRKESAKNTTTIVPTVMIVPSIAVATGRETGTPVASSDRPEE